MMAETTQTEESKKPKRGRPPATKKAKTPQQKAAEAAVAAADPSLMDGIQYADAEPLSEPEELGPVVDGKDSLTRIEEQQAAARAAIQRQQQAAAAQGVPYIPELLAQRPRPPTPEERKVIEGRNRWYQVVEKAEIRRGAAKYILVAGKVFNSNEYDVESLRRQGVQLKEVRPQDVNVRPNF